MSDPLMQRRDSMAACTGTQENRIKKLMVCKFPQLQVQKPSLPERRPIIILNRNVVIDE